MPQAEDVNADAELERQLVEELKGLRKHYGRLQARHFDSTPLLNRHVGQGHAHHTFTFFMTIASWLQEDIEVRVALGHLGVEVAGDTAQQRTRILAEREGVSERHIANLSNAGMRKLAELIRSWSATEGAGGPLLEFNIIQVSDEIVNVALRVITPSHVGVYRMPDGSLNGEEVEINWARDEQESDEYWRITKWNRFNVILNDSPEQRLHVKVTWNGSTRPPSYRFAMRSTDECLVAAFMATAEGCEAWLYNPGIDESAFDEIASRARTYGNEVPSPQTYKST